AFAEDAVPDFDTDIAPLFRKYCQACHNEQDAEGNFVLESYAQLLEGNENGNVITAGKPDESRLLELIERKTEPVMPPEGNKGPNADEIELIRAWIAGGAKNSVGRPGGQPLVTPYLEPRVAPRKPIHTAAWSPENKWIAVGQYGNVEILTPDKAQQITSLDGHTGNVNDLAVSADGSLLAAASGETGLFGEVRLWSTADWQPVQTIRSHRDSIYAVEISPDQTMLATASYDQEIKLWNLADGKLIRTLTGHNGPVYDLAFHPQGHILASASDDRTVKLWNVATGDRLDTFSQPTKAQNTVAFSPSGRYVVGGGVDNRIRVWELGPEAKEGTNIQRYAKFAHQAAISKLVFSPDGKALISAGEDQIIKIWETETFTLQQTFERQPDWTPALAVSPDNRQLLIGRLDGTLATYPLATDELGTDDSPRPIVTALEPETDANTNADLTTIDEAEPNDAFAASQAMAVPGRVNGVLQAGDGETADVDWVRFHSPAGKTWVIETAASREQSPADTKIQVFHADGQPVLRMLLRAVRDSAINFRPIDSTQNSARVDNYEEMELNQFMYIQGEVVKLFKMP
ncbi:MAG: c-type cytochrome domain-containing protein, partial [Planctomycetaceae bacterium]